MKRTTEAAWEPNWWCNSRVRQLFPQQQHDLTNDDIADVYEWGQAPADRPWIRVNFVQAVDGSVRAGDGLSDGISGPADKRVFAILRATCEAVLVGAGTARAENYGPITIRPELQEVRSRCGLEAEPALYIVSESGNINERARGTANVLKLGSGTEGLASALRKIREDGVSRLLCEGGPSLFTSLLAVGVVDELCLTTTPLLIGNSTTSLVTEQLASAASLKLAALLEDHGTLLARWKLRDN